MAAIARKIWSVFLAFTLCWGLFFNQCALAATQSAPRAAGSGKALRVALLLEHEGEQSWTKLLRRGLARAGEEFSLHVEALTAVSVNSEISPASDVERTALFRRAAGEFDLVLVGSERFHEILRDNAANYRRTLFGCVDAGIRAPNIMCVTFADEQAAFLTGAAAAMLTTRQGLPGINGEKTIGWLTGADTPAQRTLLNGFTEGARLVVPEIRVVNGISGSFDNVERADAETRRLVNQGADVIALAAGRGNISALEIVRARGVYIVGLDEDQAAALPGRVLTSIIKKADKAVYEIVAAAASGRFRGKEILVYDLENGGVDIADVFSGQPAAGQWNLQDARRRLGELRKELINGGIRVKSLRDRTLCDCL